MSSPSILWFRQDLRLSDSAALNAAADAGPIVAVYVFDENAGAAQHWWLHHSLTALSASLAERGVPLILRRGDVVAEIKALMAETGATSVYATRAYEPWWKAADAALADALTLHDGNYLVHPPTVLTGSGGRYKIFTPCWRAILGRMPPPLPVKTPERIQGVAAKSDQIGRAHV